MCQSEIAPFIVSVCVPAFPQEVCRNILPGRTFGISMMKTAAQSVPTPKHPTGLPSWTGAKCSDRGRLEKLGVVWCRSEASGLIRPGRSVTYPMECLCSCAVVWEAGEGNRRDLLLVHWRWALQGPVTHCTFLTLCWRRGVKHISVFRDVLPLRCIYQFNRHPSTNLSSNLPTKALL